MKRIERIVFATNNSHKLKEARAILGCDVVLIPLSEIGCKEDLPETSDTLEGNALQKARRVHEVYCVDCIADDTGLMVDALNGAPGVMSARYAGPGHDSAANMKKLLLEMEGKQSRKAHFSTVLALVTDEGERTFEGRVDGFIAEKPEGNDGFGYDPVFVADETGKTFASMGEEAKNAISHRGRAFRAFRDWLAALSVILMMLMVPQMNAAQWRQHPSCDGNAYHILPSQKYTYFMMLRQNFDRTGTSTQRYGQILRHDNDNDEWQWLDKSTGLSEMNVVDAAYDYANRQLVICYDNGNIDLLKDNGEKINIPGLMGASQGSKIIESVNVDPHDGDIWVTTSTGYVRIDAKKGEVNTSRDYGRKINSVAKMDDQLFVATDDGLYYGDERESSLSNFNRVGNVDKIERLVPVSYKLLLTYGGEKNNKNYYSVYPDAENGSYKCYLRSLTNEYSIDLGENGALVTGSRYIRWVRPNGYSDDYTLPGNLEKGAVAGSHDGKTIWVVNGRKGISRYTAPSGDKGWTLTMQAYIPNASNAFRCVAMPYHSEYGMLVRNHGGEQKFLEAQIATPDLLSSLKGSEWTSLSTTYRLPQTGNVYATDNPYGVAIDPNNRNHVYCGSRTKGLLRLDLSDASNSIRFGRSNDSYNGRKGFVPITDPVAAWEESCTFTTPVFDAQGNMWVSRNNQDKKTAEIWYWTPENRAATTSSSNYRPMGKLEYNDVSSSDYSKVLALTRSGRTNMIIYDSGVPGGPLMILDHGGTPGSRNDDKRVVLTNFIDQDGNSFNYSRVTSMTEDPATGRVWVTCEMGVFHFDPKEMMEGSTAVRRVKVPRNDGTNLADYLLDGTFVNCLTIDKQGRKWFGTFGAGIIITGADGTEIVRNYTVDNSEIADDIVHGISYNPDNNSMLVSTGSGLCELFLDAVSGGESDSVRAYPNPVRPGFLGVVTIDNLADYCMVKIMDASGNLVKELGDAPTGEITWDLTNNKHKRVPGGVYYILCTNGSEQDSYTKKGKILVID